MIFGAKSVQPSRAHFDLHLFATRAMDGIGAAASTGAPETRVRAMRFEVKGDDHILSVTDDSKTEADQRSSSFETEQELHQLAGAWPMKRLIAIWNNLPGVQAVQKFENRTIAIARIWHAIQPEAERSGETAAHRSPRTPRRSQVAFREGSKASQVCALLFRPEGATLNEIRSATGWQAHTVRGFISRTLRKQGRRVRSFKRNGERMYRLRA
jgi:Protein of unknown function (DUF3489)